MKAAVKKVGAYLKAQMKKENTTRMLMLFAFLLFIGVNDGFSQGQASGITGALGNAKSTIKIIVNAVLCIMCFIKLVQVVYKAFFAHREFGMDIAMLVIGLVIWGLFVTFANDILNMFGASTGVQDINN